MAKIVKKAAMHKMPNGSMMKNSKMPKAEQGYQLPTGKAEAKRRGGDEVDFTQWDAQNKPVAKPITKPIAKPIAKPIIKGAAPKAKSGIKMAKCKSGCY